MRQRARQLVYFASSDGEIPVVPSGPTLFQDQRAAARQLVEWVSGRDDVELTIRLHPLMAGGPPAAAAWWRSLSGPKVRVVPGESEIDTYALIDRATVVLSFVSSTGVEATYSGRPSISIGPTDYANLGCTYHPATIEELLALLSDNSLGALPQERCLPFGYYLSVFGERFQFFEPDGYFTGRFLGTRLSYDARWLQRLARMT
jgi:hypothetical protein